MQLSEAVPFKLGALEARPAERRVLGPGIDETLEPRVMEVLVALYASEGAVLSRDLLIEQCWGGRAVSDDAVHRVIARLRRLSEQTDGRDFTIETIAKVGYRLRTGQARAPTTPAQPGARVAVAMLALIATVALGVVLGMIALRARAPAAPQTVVTLAVMPFNDGGGVPAFAAPGVTREIRDRLGRIGGLRVIAESSARAIAAESQDARSAARRLGADLLLEGAIEGGETLRIRMEIIDGETGAVAWSNVVDSAPGDLAAAEARATIALTEYFVQRLGPDATRQLLPSPPRDPRTFALLLEAREAVFESGDFSRTGADDAATSALRHADALIDEVLAAHPEDAAALVLKANVSQALPQFDRSGGGEADRISAIIELYKRALRADPNEVNAMVALANAYRRYRWRWRESAQLFKRALAIDPNSAFAHGWYTYLLTNTGQCREALRHAQAAARLAPESNWHQLGPPRVLKCLGDFPAADRLYEAEYARQKGNLFLARELYINHLLLRRPDKARALALRVRAATNGASAGEELASRMEAGADALDGRPNALLPLLLAHERKIDDWDINNPRAEGRRPIDYYYFLAIEADIAGDMNAATRLLGKAYAERSLYVAESLPHGVLEFSPALRADPRYRAFWKTNAGLAELAALRLAALKDRQMAGRLPDGRIVEPKPADRDCGFP